MGRKVFGSGQPAHISEVTGPFRGVSVCNGLFLLARNGIGIHGFPFGPLA